MISLSLVLSFLGLYFFVFRLCVKWRTSIPNEPLLIYPFVSIIVPCRNEQDNLGSLLESLNSLRYPYYEVLVVDDESSDATVEVARSFEKVQVLPSLPKPQGWVGKSWACHRGALAAKGDFLLFTDADTVHVPESLHQALNFQHAVGAELVSAPPFHVARNFFEKTLGLFHLLPLIATNYRGAPKPGRLFAIGQYLLFKRESYFESGGHEIIKSSLVDDLDIAELFLKNQKFYQVYPRTDLYQVQMYPNFISFCRGWKRLFRLGMKRSSMWSFFELFLVFHLFVNFNAAFWAGLIALAFLQRPHGHFSVLGILLAPLNVILFILLSLAAAVEYVLDRKVVWHGRIYQDS